MRRLVVILLLAFAGVGVALPARAHNVLVGSDPKDGTTLSAAPARITLVFDQVVRQGYAQVGVTGADGTAWADGSAEVAAEKVSIKVKPLRTAGAYVVGYRILSADGHPVTGKISFNLAAGGSAVQEGAPTQEAAKGGTGDTGAQAAEAAANGGAGMAVVWIVGALLVLAAGTAVSLRRARSPAPLDSERAVSSTPEGEARDTETRDGEARDGERAGA